MFALFSFACGSKGFLIRADRTPSNYKSKLDKQSVHDLINFLQESLFQVRNWDEERGVTIPVDMDRTND